MAREAKKSIEDSKEKSLEELILNKGDGKYGLIPLASDYALVLRRREEYRHLTQPEILDIALRHLLTGEIEEAQVREATAELAAQMPPELSLGDGGKKKL